ncbi:MAG: hypothetical protein JO086_06530 [Acidimicrobiia bacterium]|nr:hypothetical protein [Acidimicrobiia bacterium]
MSVSTDRRPPSAPERQPRVKREHLIWSAAGLVILVLGIGLAALIAHHNEGGQTAELLGQQQSGGAVASIGPLDGDTAAQYTVGREAALQKATGTRAAVVSFDHYATESEARALVGQLHVVALLAAPPGGAPSVVTADMATWAQQQKASVTQERDQNTQLLSNGVDDPEFRTFYQQEVTRLNKELSGIDPKGKVVFGVVVTGPAPELQALAKKSGVRLVDVGPSAKVSDSTEYHGIRPEQTATINQNDPRPF